MVPVAQNTMSVSISMSGGKACSRSGPWSLQEWNFSTIQLARPTGGSARAKARVRGLVSCSCL